MALSYSLFLIRPPRSGVFVRLLLCLIIGTTLAGPAEYVAADAPADFPGRQSEWHGFARYDFEVGGNAALVVAPRTPAAGRPWVWHGEFFGHKPAPDIELLKRGFHVVYLRVPNMLGAPTAVKHWNEFYAELTETYGLAERVSLVGLSRGGLYCYNWAAANPEKVVCIYGDAPVCDFKSWPGGHGRGQGSPREWQRVLEQYGFANDAGALAYQGNPVDNLGPLAEANVPLLHVYGTDDKVVPWEENTGLVAKRYRALGGSIQLIEKPGIGHHPHGLVDPSPIVDFIVRSQQRRTASPLPKSQKGKDPVRALAARLEPTRRIVYKQTDQGELYLHVFDPSPDPTAQSTQPRPCFLVYHGGGWSGGEPRRMYPFADHYARQGFLAISAQYRRLNPRQGVTVFDCVADARDAVRFLRTHARQLQIAPNKVVVSGASAGGHLAVETALLETGDEASSSRPDALILLFPVIDTSSEGYGRAKIGRRWQELSPVHQVHGKMPPTLILHGTADTVTPVAGAEAFHRKMLDAGNRCELHLHEGGKHGYLMFDADLFAQALQQMDAFLTSLDLIPVSVP